MRNAINNQIEVIDNIEAAISVASSAEVVDGSTAVRITMLSRAKEEAMKVLTTLRYINQ